MRSSVRSDEVLGKKANLIGIVLDVFKSITFHHLDFEMGSDGLGGLFQNNDPSHGAEHVGGAAFVSAKDAVVVDVQLQGAVMLRIEDLNVLVGLESLVVFNPGEIGSGLRFGRAGDVDRTADKSVGLLGLVGMLMEPARFICKRFEL